MLVRNDVIHDFSAGACIYLIILLPVKFQAIYKIQDLLFSAWKRLIVIYNFNLFKCLDLALLHLFTCRIISNNGNNFPCACNHIHLAIQVAKAFTS